MSFCVAGVGADVGGSYVVLCCRCWRRELMWEEIMSFCVADVGDSYATLCLRCGS